MHYFAALAGQAQVHWFSIQIWLENQYYEVMDGQAQIFMDFQLDSYQ